MQNGVYLTKNGFAKLRNYSEEEINKYENINVLDKAFSAEIKGHDKVESLVFEQNDQQKELPVSAIFVAIGRTPDTGLFQGQIDLTESGYIKVDENLMTSNKGVFACGDVVDGSLKQIVTATGQGAVVATEAIKWLAKR